MAKRRVRAGGVEVAYLDCGPPDAAETVVLLHDGAYGTDARLAWDGLVPVLSERHRVVAPDLLGFGGTAKLATFDRTPHAANIELIGRLCRVLRLDDRPVHFVGTSFGGGLVVNVAGHQPLAWPMATGTTIGGVAGYGRRKESFARLRDYDQTMADARRITQLLVAVDPDELGGHIARRHANGLIPGHWQTLNAPRLRAPSAQPDVERESPLDFLRDCTVPLLFIEGRDDTLLEPGWAERLAAVAPHGRAVQVPGAHCPNIDHPLDVAKAILGFLDGLAVSHAVHSKGR